MEAFATALLLIGSLISLIGGVWFIIAAFQESLAWGLLCLFLPVTGLFFLVLHADRAAKPFVVSFLGSLLMIGGILIRRRLGA